MSRLCLPLWAAVWDDSGLGGGPAPDGEISPVWAPFAEFTRTKEKAG